MHGLQHFESRTQVRRSAGVFKISSRGFSLIVVDGLPELFKLNLKPSSNFKNPSGPVVVSELSLSWQAVTRHADNNILIIF